MELKKCYNNNGNIKVIMMVNFLKLMADIKPGSLENTRRQIQTKKQNYLGIFYSHFFRKL